MPDQHAKLPAKTQKRMMHGLSVIPVAANPPWEDGSHRQIKSAAMLRSKFQCTGTKLDPTDLNWHHCKLRLPNASTRHGFPKRENKAEDAYPEANWDSCKTEPYGPSGFVAAKPLPTVYLTRSTSTTTTA